MLRYILKAYNHTQERVGKSYSFILLEHQKILKEFNLVVGVLDSAV